MTVPGWMARLMPPAIVQPERSIACRVGVVELDELGGVAAGGRVLDLVDDDVGDGGLVARDPRVGGESGSPSLDVAEQPLTEVRVVRRSGVWPRRVVEDDHRLGGTDAGVVDRLHPPGGQDVVDERAQPTEVHVTPLGDREQAGHQLALLVTGLGRGHEVARRPGSSCCRGCGRGPRGGSSSDRSWGSGRGRSSSRTSRGAR